MNDNVGWGLQLHHPPTLTPTSNGPLRFWRSRLRLEWECGHSPTYTASGDKHVQYISLNVDILRWCMKIVDILTNKKMMHGSVLKFWIAHAYHLSYWRYFILYPDLLRIVNELGWGDAGHFRRFIIKLLMLIMDIFRIIVIIRNWGHKVTHVQWWHLLWVSNLELQ